MKEKKECPSAHTDPIQRQPNNAHLVRVGVVEVELGSTNSLHDRVKDTKLTGGKRTNHDATGEKTGGHELDGAHVPGDADETGGRRTFTTGALLVDLGEEGVGGVRDDGGDDTGNHTGKERDADVGSRGRLVRGGVHRLVDGLGGFALDGKLGHGVRNLLEEDGTKAGVEAEEAVGRDHAGHAGAEALGEGGVRDGPDAHGLERAEEQVCDELCAGGRGEVDVGALLPGLALAEPLGKVDLEELDTAKLEPALDKVAGGGGAETGGEGHGALGRDDLPKGVNHALVVGDGVELDAGPKQPPPPKSQVRFHYQRQTTVRNGSS